LPQPRQRGQLPRSYAGDAYLRPAGRARWPHATRPPTPSWSSPPSTTTATRRRWRPWLALHPMDGQAGGVRQLRRCRMRAPRRATPREGPHRAARAR